MTVDHNSDDSDLRDDKRLNKEEKYRNAGVMKTPNRKILT